MKIFATILFCLFSFYSFSQQEVLFFQTKWGNQDSYADFCRKAAESGYDGVEVVLPGNEEQRKLLKEACEANNLKLIIHTGSGKTGNFDELLENYLAKVKLALEMKPVLINSHTGHEFLSFDENLSLLEKSTHLCRQENIPIYHETHRGRFSYSLPETLKYINASDDFYLNLDISHWMVVHESLLQDEDDYLAPIIDRTGHIHARVGFEEGPQINDPSAPEWEKTIHRHLEIWKKIIDKRLSENQIVTITTEFGPPNYLPKLPYTQQPVSDQWKCNVDIMNITKSYIKDRIHND